MRDHQRRRFEFFQADYVDRKGCIKRFYRNVSSQTPLPKAATISADRKAAACIFMLQNIPFSEILTVPMIPLRDAVLFPGMMIPFLVGREQSLKALDHSLA